jgi:hypothetical protein
MRYAFLLLLATLGCYGQDARSWRTAPPLTDLFPEEDLWSTRTVPFAELAGGVKAVAGPDGKQVGQWGDHPRFPTVHTTEVPRDWSAKQALLWNVHAAKATDERILVGVLCDNPETHAKDFRVVAFKVDWTGWRGLVLPLDRFSAMGEPLGWDHVTGLYLFTKVFHWQPHPDTELLLGNIALGPAKDRARCRWSSPTSPTS